MKRQSARSTALILILSAFLFLVIAGVMGSYAEWFFDGKSINWLSKLAVFDRFFIDLLVILSLVIGLINRGWVLRLLAYLICGLFFLTYILQFLSIKISGEFVSLLAVDNVRHLSLLLNIQSISILLILLALLVVFVIFLERCCCAVDRKFHSLGLSLVSLSLALLISQSENWLPIQIQQFRDAFYSDRLVRMAHKSPVKSLYKVVLRSDQNEIKALTAEDVEQAKAFGISLNLDSRYPLIKQTIYTSELPFKRNNNRPSQPNIIVFFSEGLSARTIDIYDGLKTDLTPNISRFAKQSMIVDNYFNHTYATYNGLLGQLCSFFPVHGGIGGWDTHYDDVKSIRYRCIHNLLQDEGYETIFLDTHRADKARIDEMMAQLQFDRVFTAEDMVGKYIEGEPLRQDAMSDNQLIDGLIGVLKDRETNDTKQPFFLSLYNLETHAFQKIQKDGKRYIGQNNYILDSIHNYDFAFGRFWDYFKSSGFADSTIIIFTSDHAHFHGKDFRELFREDKDYDQYFIDQIPLVIYDPTKDLPKRFDARYASSIDFAPTVAHWLNIENQPTPFLGNSIFETSRVRDWSLASTGDEIYFITPEGVDAYKPDSNKNPKFEFADNLLKSLRQLELHNRIWPSEEMNQ